ncbi:MAG: branched-chain amino acid transaminase [Leptospiraceae bacterium]|nr:branched-chain amino acid transaminase [Leptospiraceae bacterium]MCB1201051.1 branched-chain amino acid transaminase [Leptospiraceae bacterium]
MLNADEMPCYFQGRYVPLKDANINIRTHAMQYGTAVFGGIRGYWNAEKKNLYVFRLHDHWQRLRQSGKIMQMHWQMEFEEFEQIVLKILRDGNWQCNVYLRPVIYKNALELSPRLHNVTDDFSVYAIPLNDYLDTRNGLKVCVSSWTRISDNQIPTRAKATGGYINSALAKSEAIQNGFDEAIFLDVHGNVSEGSAENLFIVRNGKLITATVTDSILEGITRRSILEIAQNLGIVVIERPISRTELYVADEAFFSGTGVQVAWISSVDRRTIGSGTIGALTEKLQNTFFKIVTGEDAAYSKWQTSVY